MRNEAGKGKLMNF